MKPATDVVTVLAAIAAGIGAGAITLANAFGVPTEVAMFSADEPGPSLWVTIGGLVATVLGPLVIVMIREFFNNHGINLLQAIVRLQDQADAYAAVLAELRRRLEELEAHDGLDRRTAPEEAA